MGVSPSETGLEALAAPDAGVVLGPQFVEKGRQG